MNKTALILAFSLLAGCATTRQFNAAPQFYRAANSDKQITITGKLEATRTEKVIYADLSNTLTVFFDNAAQIVGHLDAQGFGEFNGDTYDGKKTSASCATKIMGQGFAELRCTIYIDNERAATLIM